MSSAQENKAVSRRVAEEIFNGGNLDLADELYTPNYVLHDPSLPEDLHGPEDLKQYAAMNLGAFPDVRVSVEDQIAEGEMVVTRWRATGTHTGELLGIPPHRKAHRDIGDHHQPLLGGPDRGGLVPERRPRDDAAARRDPFTRRGFLRVLRRGEPQLRNPIHRSAWNRSSRKFVTKGVINTAIE